MAETFVARLKPYNPRRGCVLKTYSAGTSLFRVERGWYEVDAELAKYLRTVHQNNDDPSSPLAFDVCTQDEAARLDAAEKKAAEAKASPDSPIRSHRPSRADASRAAAVVDTGTVTTADLPVNQKDDTTDAMPGDEGDLDSDDLAADAAKPAAPPNPVPGAPRSFSPRTRASKPPTGG